MSDQNTNDDALSLTENGGTRAEISTGNAVNAALQNVNTPDDGVTSAHVALESPHAANRRDSTLFASLDLLARIPPVHFFPAQYTDM